VFKVNHESNEAQDATAATGFCAVKGSKADALLARSSILVAEAIRTGHAILPALAHAERMCLTDPSLLPQFVQEATTALNSGDSSVRTHGWMLIGLLFRVERRLSGSGANATPAMQPAGCGK